MSLQTLTALSVADALACIEAGDETAAARVLAGLARIYRREARRG